MATIHKNVTKHCATNSPIASFYAKCYSVTERVGNGLALDPFCEVPVLLLCFSALCAPEADPISELGID